MFTHIEEHEKEKGNCKTEAWGMPHWCQGEGPRQKSHSKQPFKLGEMHKESILSVRQMHKDIERKSINLVSAWAWIGNNANV